jgi:hypothetical protein
MTDVVTTQTTSTVTVVTPASATVNVSGVNSAVVIPPGVGPTGPQGPQGPEGPTPEEESFTVVGGSLGTQPTFNGAPLFSGSYIKVGGLVYFQIQVDFDNITSFGTGQYYVELPFVSKYGTMMRDGCLHRASNGNQYAINGHVFAGSDTLTLWFTSGTGQDEAFDHNSPYTLQVEDNFHVSGDYIAEPLNS